MPRVQGLGFRVQGLVFRNRLYAKGLGFRFQGLGFSVQEQALCQGFGVQVLGFSVQGLGFRVQCLGIGFMPLVQGLGFRVQGLVFRNRLYAIGICVCAYTVWFSSVQVVQLNLGSGCGSEGIGFMRRAYMCVRTRTTHLRARVCVWSCPILGVTFLVLLFF